MASDTRKHPPGELIDLVEALARAAANRDFDGHQNKASNRVRGDDPRHTRIEIIEPAGSSSRYRPADLTRALKASAAAGITPDRVELLTDGRIVLHFAQGDTTN